jgi:hypothetical protein
MRVGGVRTVGQEGLEISAVMIEFSRLRDTYTVESNAALTEQGMQEIVCSLCEILVIQSSPIRFD